jgi:hypothetical protein
MLLCLGGEMGTVFAFRYVNGGEHQGIFSERQVDAK